MKALKKFLIWIGALLPMSAFGVAPVVVGGLLAGVGGIIGVSIWRSASPVNLKSAIDFFSSCWTCQIFSDIMVSMSNLLPKAYHALGMVVIPMSATLLAIFVAWNLFRNMLNNKMDAGSKIIGNFSTHILRLTILVILLMLPLPRLITDVFIEPALVLGTSFDYIVSDNVLHKDDSLYNNSFSECMVATAMADPVSTSVAASEYGAFSPKLRHQLTCEVANIHQITGLGMSVGWTLMNMAFSTDYMHKILVGIPIFPNVPMALCGVLILVLFLFALLPIPLYFLEVFITLSMDLIMLPLMLMSWMFDNEDFKLFPKGGKTIRKMIDDVIKAVVGIALTVVFLTFSIMFLNAAFGKWDGANVLEQAIANNDSTKLIDGLFFNNDSIITVVLMGIFIAMFMTMIPQLTSMLFKIQISDEYYQTAKKDINILWNGFNRVVLGKKSKNLVDEKSSDSSGGGESSSGESNSASPMDYTRIKYLESNGMQYVDTGFKPDSNTSVMLKVQMISDSESVLFGARQNTDSFSAGMSLGTNPSDVHVEHGSFSGDANTGVSLSNTIIHIYMGKTQIKILDESESTELASLSYPAGTFGELCNMYLFGLNDSYVEKSRAWCRIYRCSIFDDGTLVRDLVPVIDSDGKACLYDITNHKFYHNGGTTPFVAGPKI